MTISMRFLLALAALYVVVMCCVQVTFAEDGDVIEPDDYEAAQRPPERNARALAAEVAEFTMTYTPASSSAFVGTVAPEVESTFFGLFPTKNLYMAVGLACPALFLLYKLSLACWFCTAGRRKFAKEDREREARMVEGREELERSTAAKTQQAHPMY